MSAMSFKIGRSSRQAAFLMAALMLFSGYSFSHEGDAPAAKASTEHAAALGKPGDPKKVARTIKVSMSDEMRFQPSSITVKRNETIRFVVANNGKTKHEMVLGTMAELKKHAALMQKFPSMEHEDPNAVTVEPGKTGTLIWQFTRAGKFDFACLVPGHFEAGMIGRIEVSR
jgi:uncharacterized cupredoxin-like copper-binding protein